MSEDSEESSRQREGEGGVKVGQAGDEEPWMPIPIPIR